jgi:hypothetical protein
VYVATVGFDATPVATYTSLLQQPDRVSEGHSVATVGFKATPVATYRSLLHQEKAKRARIAPRPGNPSASPIGPLECYWFNAEC